VSEEQISSSALAWPMADLDQAAVVAAAEACAKQELDTDTSGHDWWHIERVRNLALALAREEGADPFVTEVAALLHDIGDVKLSSSRTTTRDFARRFCDTHGVPSPLADHILSIVSLVSFRGALVPDGELSREGRCVRDADRLDAMGAIGIGRAFTYGGHIGRPMWDPDAPYELHSSEDEYRQATSSTVNHFFEKLLLLKDRMGTSAGQRRAAHRHAVITTFLNEFFTEWRGDDLEKAGGASDT
jgi:uncharacterized protein